MDDHPSGHHLDPNPEIITMAELDHDPPQTSKCFTLSAIVLFLAFVASSVPNLLSPQPRTNTSVAKASSVVVQPSFIATNLPGQQQQFHQRQQQQQQQQQQQEVLPGAIVYTSPTTTSPSQATADRLSPDQSPPTQNTPHQDDQQQQQQREPLIEKTTILELVLIAINVSFRVVFWFLSLIYRSSRYAVVQPAGILMRLLETPLEMMREIYKTVMPVYSFFTVAAIIGVVVGGSATWIAQVVISALGADQDKTPLPPPSPTLVVVPPRQRTASSSSSSSLASPPLPLRPRRTGQGRAKEPALTQASSTNKVAANASSETVYHGQGQDLGPRRNARRAPPPSEYDYDDDDDDDDDDSDWHRS